MLVTLGAILRDCAVDGSELESKCLFSVLIVFFFFFVKFL